MRKEKYYGKSLNCRTARAAGHSGIIFIPACCIGQKYDRYMDAETGIITLIPCGPAKTEEKRENDYGPAESPQSAANSNSLFAGLRHNSCDKTTPQSWRDILPALKDAVVIKKGRMFLRPPKDGHIYGFVEIGTKRYLSGLVAFPPALNATITQHEIGNCRIFFEIVDLPERTITISAYGATAYFSGYPMPLPAGGWEPATKRWGMPEKLPKITYREFKRLMGIAGEEEA